MKREKELRRYRLSRIEGSYFGAPGPGRSTAAGATYSGFSRPNVGGPEALRKARNERHFDLTLPHRLFSPILRSPENTEIAGAGVEPATFGL